MMNNQEMRFSPQENSPHEQNTIDLREQVPEQQSWRNEASRLGQDSYEAGYSEARPEREWISEEGEKLRPSLSPRGADWQWIVGALVILVLAVVLWALINIILGFILLLLGLVVAVLAINQLIARKVVMPPSIFLVDGKPTLVIRNPAGSLRIHSGVTNTVEVMATKYVSGWFVNMEERAIDYAQDGNTIRVMTDGSYYRWLPMGGLRGVTFDITVPQHCDIDIQGNAGTLRIEGVHGQVQAGTSAGTIDVKQSTLEGQSHLTTNAGTIHVQQTTLEGQVNFHTNAGIIYFAGKLDPRGEYRMENSMGTIDVLIPPDSSFTLTAAAMGTLTNEFGSTLVGPAPRASLKLKSNIGTISIRKK